MYSRASLFSLFLSELSNPGSLWLPLLWELDDVTLQFNVLLPDDQWYWIFLCTLGHLHVFFEKGAFILCILTSCHVCFLNLCYKEVPHPMAVLFIVLKKKAFKFLNTTSAFYCINVFLWFESIYLKWRKEERTGRKKRKEGKREARKKEKAFPVSMFWRHSPCFHIFTTLRSHFSMLRTYFHNR